MPVKKAIINVKKKYNKMDPVDHVLARPDTYLGNCRPKEHDEYIATSDFRISKKKIEYANGLLRIYIECLSNILDNYARSKKSKNLCTTIKVSINKKTGETSMWNDGDYIPIEFDDDNDCYNHSLVFGNLLTSSNYNDEEDRYEI